MPQAAAVAVTGEAEANNRIPIRNLWVLMLFASEFRYTADLGGGTEDIDEDVADLGCRYPLRSGTR
jgi:hypothetical protein